MNIPKILDTIAERYDANHEILINCHEEAFILDAAQDIEKTFNTLDELYEWINKPTCTHIETECN